MKMRSKGKVHPSPSACSSEALSVLKQLPAAILGVISTVLSLEDKQVLAYMITRSIRSSTANTNSNNKSSSSSSAAAHKRPAFDCDCFECYTNYWFMWDSSPNRQLIHQAIEAFEDHFTTPDHHHQSFLIINTNKNHKGLARKVLPDVLGFFNSRLWSLWSPNL